MKVSELAKACGVTPDTVRHYTKEGLITADKNPINGYHEYNRAALQRVKFIQQSRTLGFSLKQIAEILAEADKGDSPCPLVRELLEQKVPETKRKIAELQAHLAKMEAALATWATMADGTPNGHSICCLIEEWEQNQDSQGACCHGN
ncbi:MerR family transcriptional regulator [Maribrevibacterium harenarium]|uniref:MerR family transcriptional regulator n=1 Tax=Maribrevibacterium harenarium TaxID=2589817 RepID=A0A501X5C6_9GAMM|nr:MerR family DNA-binding protein [Maribrevibacterium harenarium]TPE55651.1 MerR family transcriptional regulator [Maribrevibacterium harenarium]